MTLVRPPPFVLAVTGTSETTGKLAAFPVGWRQQLSRELPLQPEAIGEVIIYDKGHGGWTSADILAEAPDIAHLRPNHILAEAGDINDCVDFGGGPAISRPQKILNMQAMVAIWQAADPDVDITFQTMNPVSAAGGASRPTLADYYTDTMVQAAILGLGGLDNYAAWPKPLPEWMSNAFDGLHPVWANSVETYAYRAILFRMRQKMAAWWGLAAPVAPVYPTAPDVDGLFIAGGGAGGDTWGGGGGAGGIIRVRDYLAAFLGPFGIGAAGLRAAGLPGGNGGDTFVGIYRAIGGGGGGLGNGATNKSFGHDGGSSGGAGTPPPLSAPPGASRLGQGFNGGRASATAVAGAGGGGGCCSPGGDGAISGGVGGLGWTVDVPGVAQDVCGGGPGGVGFGGPGVRPPYGLGGGPTKFGGGGQGGTQAGTNGDDGGIGKGWIWYPGAPRCLGGVITTSGGLTVHDLTGTGTLV